MGELVDVGEEPGAGRDAASLERSRATSLAFCWRLASELVRRHPDTLLVVPEPRGMYDFVTVFDHTTSPVTPVISLNAAGSNSRTPSGAQILWATAYADGADRAAWLAEVERMCGLKPPQSPLPASTGRSLVARFVAAFLASQIGGRSGWQVRALHGVDEIGWHVGAVDEWERSMLLKGGAPRPGRDAVLYLVRDGAREPEVLLMPSGRIARSTGATSEITEIHKDGAPITALLMATVADLMP